MEIHWKQRRRGQTLNLKFSVTYDISFNIRAGDLIITKPINVFNLALIKFKFKVIENESGNKLTCYISVKNHESATDSTIDMTVSYMGLRKQFLCTNYWIEDIHLEYEMIPEDEENCVAQSKNILFYHMEVNITMQNRPSEPLPVYRKLYEDANLTDFHLTAKDGKVAVHKAVLGVHSEMFLTMLNGDWKETSMGCISIDGVTVQTLDNLKRYMYLRSLPADCVELQQLLLVAGCYLVDNLKTDCIAELVKLVTPANFGAIIEFACQNNVPELIKTIVMENTDNMINDININNNNQAVAKE